MIIHTYISLLRGVNMTGHNLIKMADLVALYKKMGFRDAETYIQSGNVVFTYSGVESESDLSKKIEKTIKDNFSYNIPVMLRTIEEFRRLYADNPFLGEEKFDPSRMAVVFLHDGVTEIQAEKVKGVDYPPDKFIINGREIFIFCPNGFGKTKLYTNFFENKMKVTGTARNWKTVETLLKIAADKQ
jgi:uncharacterized protein (DUF1697 family)